MARDSLATEYSLVWRINSIVSSRSSFSTIQSYTALAREFGGQVSMGEGSMVKEIILQSGVLSDYCVPKFKNLVTSVY